MEERERDKRERERERPLERDGVPGDRESVES